MLCVSTDADPKSLATLTPSSAAVALDGLRLGLAGSVNAHTLSSNQSQPLFTAAHFAHPPAAVVPGPPAAATATVESSSSVASPAAAGARATGALSAAPKASGARVGRQNDYVPLAALNGGSGGTISSHLI